MPGNEPAVPRPALDFLRVVREEDREGVPFLEDAERNQIDRLLARHVDQGLLAPIGREAHGLLVTIRHRDERMRFLSDAQRAELARILAPQSGSQSRPQPRFRPIRVYPRNLAHIAIAVIAAIVVVIAIVVGSQMIQGILNNPGAQPGVNQPAQAPVHQAPQLTNAQKMHQLLGPWTEIMPTEQDPGTKAQPVPGNKNARHIELLDSSGRVFVSQAHALEFDATNPGAWQPANPSALQQRTVHGDHVTIGINDSVDLIVGVNQPFIMDQDLSNVYMVDGTDHVWSLTLAQAIGQLVTTSGGGTK